MRSLAIPKHVQALCKELGIKSSAEIAFPIPDYAIERGGVITSEMVAIPLPNVAANPQRFCDLAASDLAALGHTPVLGVWHTHTHNTKPSPRDQRARLEWAKEGIPLYIIITPERAWFWVTD